jgi:hypothetical protein
MTQTAVDKFHDAVNDMIARRRPMTSNEVAKIWLECKEIEKEQMIDIVYQIKHYTYFPEYTNYTTDQLIDKYYNETYEGNK